MLNSVWNELEDFMNYYSGVHRGTGIKSIISSKVYDTSHDIIGHFVGADLALDSVIMVKNTTEAINKLSYRLNLSSGDIIISTDMEHHSNDLPWRSKAAVSYLGIDEKGNLNSAELKNILKQNYPRVKLVAVCGASNVTGHINDVHLLAQTAHEFKCPILVDGAQLIPHRPFSMRPHNDPHHIDFLTFSGHKIFSPLGSGVLIGPRAFFDRGQPEYTGGGTVNVVTDDRILWSDPPDKDEAGSPNVPGTFALARTLVYLEHLGMQKLTRYEENLTSYAFEKIKKLDGIHIYGDKNRVGVISINIEGIPHALVGAVLCFEAGIGVRTGCFCAQKYVRQLLGLKEVPIIPDSRQKHLLPGMVRISLAAYNSKEEIDTLLQWLSVIRDNADEFKKRYKFSPKHDCFYPSGRDDRDIEAVYKRYLSV
ncbi:MAG TPA: aminotransferase class V-fold PLP-dependent enzyme, partial [Syntrophomonadaceae bacterium]|nr:aminotransferase class V-fold PLP-dependent enzyme [Syntrophomonadaceae bacterium]